MPSPEWPSAFAAKMNHDIHVFSTVTCCLNIFGMMLKLDLRRGHYPQDKRIRLIYEIADISLPGNVLL